MRVFEEREVTYATKRCVRLVCDLCKCEAPDSERETWGEDSFKVAETTISLKEGSSYPEGGMGELLKFDICPDCFRDRLVPWMKSQGAEPTETDWDR